MKRTVFICMIALFVCGIEAFAGQAKLQGRVSDGTGNPVPDLNVVVRNTTSGTEHQATTNQNGEFLIAGLEAGKYFVQSQGTQSATAISIDADSTSSLALQTDSVGRVQIVAETIVTDKGTALIKTIFTNTQNELLPQPNAIAKTGEFYGPYNLSLLSDGVTTGSIVQAGIGPSVGGRPNTSNNFHVNGTDNNNQAVAGPLVTITNEATTDFTLMQGQMEPQSGHATGGQLNVLLFQGSNLWHGGFYDYLNNRKLNAVEPALSSGVRTQRYDQNRLGAKIGGPIVRDRLFVFANVEYIPLRSVNVALGPVLAPTSEGFAIAASRGDVSATNLAVLRNSVRVSDTAVATASVGGATIPLGMVDSTTRTNQDQYNGIANVDWNMDGKSHLAFRYVHNDMGSDNFTSALPSFMVPGHKRALLGTIGYTAAFTTGVTFAANAGYNRLDQSVGGGDSNFPGLTAFPNINIQGLGLSLGSHTAAGRSRANTYQAASSVDWITPNHRVRFGVDARRLQSIFGNVPSSSGSLTYASLQGFLLDLQPDGQRTFGSPSFVGDRSVFFAFVQDAIRFRGLDVELGLGYQWAQLPESLRRQGSLSSLNAQGPISFAEPKIDKVNFAPRIGLAWSPNAGRTVLRGGFGMLYDALNGNSSLLSPDMALSTTRNSGVATPGFLAQGGLTAPTTASGGAGAWTFDQQLPYTIHWNGAVSHSFFGKLATELKYMGNHAVHQPLQAILNDPAGLSASNSLPVFFTNPGQAALNSLQLTQQGIAARTNAYTAAGFMNPIETARPEGTSWYNAVVLKVTEAFTAGTQVSAQYTYSDVRTDATGTGSDLAFGRRMEQAPWARKHRASMTPVLDVASMMPNSNGWVKNIVADLSIVGTLSYARAARVPLYGGAGSAAMSSSAGSGVFVNPNGVSGTSTGVTPLTNSSGQTVAFLATNSTAQFASGAPGSFSTERPTLRLDDVRNVDLSIVKRFSIADRGKIELRGDGFNVLNRAQFTGMPITTLGAGMGAGFTPNILSSAQFNNIRDSLSGNPRTIQLALRVMF